MYVDSVDPALLSDGEVDVGGHVLLKYEKAQYPAHIVAIHDMQQTQKHAVECFADCIVSDLAQMDPPDEGVLSCPGCRYSDWKDNSDPVFLSIFFQNYLACIF